MTIHVVSSINQGFLQHFLSMAMSVVHNSKQKIDFHIMSNDLGDNIKDKIKDLFKSYKSVLFHFYNINDNLLKKIEIQAEHLTIQTLYRLLIPKILPDTIDKVIYLDSDLVVETDITHLFDINIEEYYVGATNEIYEPSIKILDLETPLHYFNAGVMLLNLHKWRNNSFTEKCLDFAKNNQEKLLLADQDILNGLLQGEWKKIPLEWNLVKGVWNNYEEYCNLYSKNYIDKVMESPFIIHYTSPSKPWHWLCQHHFKDRYFYYLDMTRYPYIKFPELQFLNQKDNIFIFGSGKAGQSTLKILKDKNMIVKGFYDNNKELWGETVCNIKVNSPESCKHNSNDFIIIASMYYKEITTQLNRYGFKEFIDFCRIEDLQKLGSL